MYRTTASAIYNRRVGGANWQTTLAWGRNDKKPGGTTDAYLLESAMTFAGPHTLFGRIERVEKDELFQEDEPLHHEVFVVKKASLGYVYDFARANHVKYRVGAVISKHFIPGALESVYGNAPWSYMSFARIKLE
jgi:hypothetical protein